MAQWFTTGDPDFVPAPLPAARDGFAYVQTQDALWVLGGWDAGYLAETSTVYKYDIHTNSWSTETPVSFTFEAYSRGVIYNDELYFFTPDGNLHKYHTGTGTTTTIGASGTTGYHDLALMNGIIYVGLSGVTPRQYDIGLTTWSDVPGTTPIPEDRDYASVIEHQDRIVVIGGTGISGRSDAAWTYNPATSLWHALPDLPIIIQWHSCVLYRNAIHILSGETTGGVANTVVYQLSYDSQTWSTPYDVVPEQLAGQAAGLVHNQIIVAGGYDYNTLDAASRTLMLGDGLSYIDAVGGVDYPIEVSTSISAIGDVLDGPGVSSSILAFGVLGSTQDSYLFLSADITDETDLVAGGAGSAGEAGTIFPPGGDISFALKDGEFWSYNFSHSLGSGVTGQSTQAGRNAAPYLPIHVTPTEVASNPTYEWSRGSDVTTGRTADSLTLFSLQDNSLTELLDADAIEDIEAILEGNGLPELCALPMDAELCGTEWKQWYEQICGFDTTNPLLPQILPTRRELATDAALSVGVLMHIIEGPGLYGLDELVDSEYRTLGKSSYEVINDMLLGSNPRVWFTPGIMHIDGRELPAASLTEPIANLEWTPGLWIDSSVDSGSITVESNATNFPSEAPSLQEFLDKCDEEDTAGLWTGSFIDSGGIYDDDAPASGTGAVGDFYLNGYGSFYEKVTDSIWTRRGSIIDLASYDLGFLPQFRILYTADPEAWDIQTRETGQVDWVTLFPAITMVSYGVDGCPRTVESLDSGVLQWTERSGFDSEYMEIDYLIEKLGGNIVREEKVTKAKKYAIRLFAGSIRGASLESSIQPVEWSTVTYEYADCCPNALVSVREVIYAAAGIQKFDAFGDPIALEPGEDGTILMRDTSTVQKWHAEGWLRSKIETTIEFDQWLWGYTPTYKNSSRDEAWIPIGGGLWWNQISESGSKHVAIWQSNEPVDLRASPGINTSRVITDGGPPTITCGDDGPCGVDETCVQKAQREYQEALDEWLFEVGIVDAQNVNRPNEVLKQQLSINRSTNVRVGDTVTTSRGPGYVARVSWSGNSGQTGSPGESVGVEVWSRIP